MNRSRICCHAAFYPPVLMTIAAGFLRAYVKALDSVIHAPAEELATAEHRAGDITTGR